MRSLSQFCVQTYLRSMPIDVDYGSYVPPSEYDVLLNDITEADVIEVSHELGQIHHSEAQTAPEFPIVGVFKGGFVACCMAASGSD